MLSIISVQEMLLKGIELPSPFDEVRSPVHGGLSWPELSIFKVPQMIWTYGGGKSGLKRDG